MIALTVLAENSVRKPGWIAEHGLAWWIDTGAHRVLFDTGQGMALPHNARVSGLDLASADAVVLSHGHYDHVGGLPGVLEVAKDAVLRMHPRAIEPKFSGAGGRSRKISTEYMEGRRFEEGARGAVMAGGPCEIVPGVWATGEVPRTNDFEDVGGPFFLDAGLSVPDPLLDDQALWFRACEGLVVVLGCAHAGVVNTVRHVIALAGGGPVHAILGGAHLGSASPERIARTVAALREFGPALIGFNHCTGAKALRRIEAEFGERCANAGVASRWEFD